MNSLILREGIITVVRIKNSTLSISDEITANNNNNTNQLWITHPQDILYTEGHQNINQNNLIAWVERPNCSFSDEGITKLPTQWAWQILLILFSCCVNVIKYRRSPKNTILFTQKGSLRKFSSTKFVPLK